MVLSALGLSDHEGRTLVLSALGLSDREGRTLVLSALGLSDREGRTLVLSALGLSDREGRTLVLSALGLSDRESRAHHAPNIATFMAGAHMALGEDKRLCKQTTQKLLEHSKRKKDGFNPLILRKTKKEKPTRLLRTASKTPLAHSLKH